MARCVECGVAGAVLLACARAFVAGAVDLDAQVLLWPVEVDLDAVELGVDERFGELGVLDLGEELILESAAGAGAAWRWALREASRTASSWRPVARVIAWRVASRLKRLRNAASWITFASCAAVSTEERSTSRRAIVVTGIPSWTVTSRRSRLRVLRTRTPGSVRAVLRAPSRRCPPGPGAATPPRASPPQMAQHGALPGRQRPRPSSARAGTTARARPRTRLGTSRGARPRGHALRRAASQPEIRELRGRDKPVLPGGEAGQLRIEGEGCVTFVSSWPTFVIHPPIMPPRPLQISP